MSKISIVGDIIPHHQLLASCCTGKGEYNFDNCFKDIEEELKSDLTICNFESSYSSTLPFVGHMNLYRQFRDNKEYDYLLPNAINMILINSNKEFLDYICKYFNCLCVANNHTYDGGHKAFNNLLNSVKDSLTTGYNNKGIIFNINNLKVGIYNYTCYTKKIVQGPYPKVNKYNTISADYLHSFRDDCDILIILPH